MNGPQLVKYHNELVQQLKDPDFKQIDGPWKRSVEILRNKIVSVQSELAGKVLDSVTAAETEKPTTPETEEVADVEEGVVAGVYLSDEELQKFKAPTIRETALRLLCHVVSVGQDKRTTGLPYDCIVESIRRLFPESKTTRACLRWYAVKVRVGETDYEQWRLVQRRPRSLPKAK